MEHLQELYLAILNRFKILLNTENENDPLTELRLDIEQLIQLLTKELNVEYDQQPLDPIQNKTTIDITNSFWDQNDDDE